MVCDYCGIENDVRINNFYRWDKKRNINEYKCINCYRNKISLYSLESRRTNIYDKVNTICKKYNYELITTIEEINTVNSIIKYRCQKHGIKERRAFLFIYGEHICPDCSVENSKLSPLKIKELINSRGVKIYNHEEYIDTITPNLQIECLNCSKIFTTSFNSFYYTRNNNPQYCPSCSKRYSSGETQIMMVLDKYKIDYVYQKTFKECKDKKMLPFDFYLPQHNIIIEYDGEQHYIPINFGGGDTLEYNEKHDKIKNEYCLNNNIGLIRIPYYDYDNIEKIIIETLNILIA